MIDVINVSEIKEKIAFHLDQAKKLQSALDLITGVVSVQSIKDTEGKPAPSIYKPKKEGKTFFEKLTEVLSNAERPLRGNEIKAHDNFENLSYSAFSAQLSGYVGKGKVMKIENKFATSNSDKYSYKLP